jgi:alpha-glucuronidase
LGKTRETYESLEKCPENMLLWFHHVPWDYKMKSGKILWDELCLHYQRGVDWVEQARKQWNALEGSIDSDVFSRVSDKFAVQETDAGRWRDACILYFQTFSKREIPAGVDKPTLTLEQIKQDPPKEYP